MRKYPKEIRESRLYRIWNNMKCRCYTKNSGGYVKYGAKGIRVCDEWRTDFMTFYNWALSNGYSPLLTIDRIDGDKGYSPENCRWATAKQQMNNVKYNVVLKRGNESHTVAEWSEILGVKAHNLYRRKKAGWDDERILSTPIRQKK